MEGERRLQTSYLPLPSVCATDCGTPPAADLLSG